MLPSRFDIAWLFSPETAHRPSRGRLIERVISSVAIFALLGSLSVLSWPSHANADEVHKTTHHNKDGSYNELWYSEENDQYYTKQYDKDGNLKAIYVYMDNPNPEEGTTTPGDQDSRVRLALQNAPIIGIVGDLRDPQVEDSPLGQLLTGQGKGKAPAWNPSDVYYESGFGGGGGGGGFVPNGGSFGQQLKHMAKKGNKDDGDDDGDNGAKPGDVGLWGPDMPGPPEIVNPSLHKGSAFRSLVRHSFSTAGHVSPRVAPVPARRAITGALRGSAFSAFGGGHAASPSATMFRLGR